MKAIRENIATGWKGTGAGSTMLQAWTRGTVRRVQAVQFQRGWGFGEAQGLGQEQRPQREDRSWDERPLGPVCFLEQDHLQHLRERVGICVAPAKARRDEIGIPQHGFHT